MFLLHFTIIFINSPTQELNMREFIAQIALEQHDINKRADFVLTEVATEGIAKAIVTDIGHGLHNTGTMIKGWFEGLSKKRNHINEIANSTIEWLKDEDRANKNLDLDMGSFKTWMKTSETYLYRYYYILNDTIYKEIVDNPKKGEISELERLFEYFVDQSNALTNGISSDMKDRRSATRMLDNIRKIKDLIVIVEKYRSRVNLIFDLLEKQERMIKGFPFQLMLRGMADLRQTVKKIVNLAT